jgi:hypothetical protein
MYFEKKNPDLNVDPNAIGMTLSKHLKDRNARAFMTYMVVSKDSRCKNK